MPFVDFGEIADANSIIGYLRKIPSQATVANAWVDLSMGGGQPQPNYYAGNALEATVLNPLRGIYHGDVKSPSTLHLYEWSLVTPTAAMLGMFQLCDYLLFYPSIDLDEGSSQVMGNATPLPRYTDGNGVRAALVAVTPTAGGGSFTYTYVNQDGASKTSPVIFLNTVPVTISTVLTGPGGLVFLPMADGDTGIRSVTTFDVITVGGGLATLVLVLPLASHSLPELNVQHVVNFVHLVPQMIPRIFDGAFLGMFIRCSGSVASGTLVGNLKMIWK